MPAEPSRPLWPGYVVAVAATGFLVSLRLWLDEWFADRAPLLPLLAAVALAAWVGRRGAGLFATALGAGAGVCLLASSCPPSVWLQHPGNIAHVLIFILIGALVSGMCEALHRAGEREARQRYLFERIAATSPDAIYVYDLVDNRNLYCNPPAASLGYTPDGPAEPDSGVLDPKRIHGDDRKQVSADRRRFDALADGEVIDHTFRLQQDDGSYRWIRCRESVLERGPGRRPTVILGVAQDVTAPHNHEKQLQVSEEQLREERDRLNFVVESCGIGLWLNPLPLGQLVWNAQVKTHFHLPPDAPSPTIDGFFAMLHPDDREPVRRAITAALESNGLFDCEYRTVNPSTSAVKWIRAVGRATYAPDGTPRRFDGITLDVTARTQAEIALRDLANQLRFITDHAAVLIVQCDAGARYTFANAPYAERYGFRPEEVVGKHIAEVVGKAAYESFRRFVEAALRGEHVDFEALIPYDQVGPRWVRAIYVPQVETDGTVSGFVAVIQDVTDRKQAEQVRRESEERFARFMQHLPGLAWIKDSQGRYVYVNEAAETAFRIPRSQLYGKADDEVFSPAVAAQFRTNDRLALEGGAGVQVVETLGHADGVLHYSLVSKFPIPGPDGQPALVGGMAIDITDQKKAEEALVEADRRKDEFLATLAHELRNPLAPLRSHLQLLHRAGSDRAAVEKSLTVMERHLRHLVILVDDLLNISRIARGKLTLRTEPVELATAVEHAVEAVRPLIEENRHELTVETPPEPVVIVGDLTRLAQVVGNMLTNSAKYTPRGGHIRISFARDGGEAVVSVTDDGIGIPQADLTRVFEKFSRVDRPLENATAGLGIGLALVKELVELHGGRVAAHSDGEGRGTTVTVRFPATDGVPPPRPVPARCAPRAEPSADGRRRKLLVVDDNQDGAESLAALLELIGNEVRIAHDGLEAVALAEEFRPDVILMDVGLPRLNGLDATRRIREQPWGSSLHIVALTGWGQDADRERSREAGCDGHLVKPVELSTLTELLDRLRANA